MSEIAQLADYIREVKFQFSRKSIGEKLIEIEPFLGYLGHSAYSPKSNAFVMKRLFKNKAYHILLYIYAGARKGGKGGRCKTEGYFLFPFPIIWSEKIGHLSITEPIT